MAIIPNYRYGLYYDPPLFNQPMTGIIQMLTERTPEQQEALRLQEEEAQRQAEERYRESIKADAKARELLLSRLTPTQKASFLERNEFLVKGSEGGVYIIKCNSVSGNVTALRGPDSQERLCALPVGVPWHDVWLAQKLLLESDESAFLAKAVNYGQPSFFRTLNFQ